jgi:ribosomal protein S18 acetylase RimI-like enzyme
MRGSLQTKGRGANRTCASSADPRTRALDYTIVPIAEAHVRGFRAALDAVARERRYLAFLEAPPLDEVELFIRRNIERGNPGMVAIAGGEVVGWCDITAMSRAVFAHRGTLGMGVLEAYRGVGIGRALIEATLAAARVAGLSRIELEVLADNERAIALYRAVGFVVEGVKRDAYRVDGRSVDLVDMALLFDGGAA